ncbi:MAG: hypothetical protein AAGA48_14905 [Myxococcota bacterium]
MDREALIEQVVNAFRARDADGRIRSAPAFHDLDEVDRKLAFEATEQQRALEASLDPQGLSTTARALLERVRATS